MHYLRASCNLLPLFNQNILSSREGKGEKRDKEKREQEKKGKNEKEKIGGKGEKIKNI